MNLIQKIRSILIPEIGLNVEPKFVQESVISTDFSRTIAHVVGRTGERSIIIKATSDGRLMVAAAGASMEIYNVERGDAEGVYAEEDTFPFDDAQYVTDFRIEDFEAEIQFRNITGVWGDDKYMPVGAHSIDFIHYGVRIQNRVALEVSNYEITTYR